MYTLFIYNSISFRHYFENGKPISVLLTFVVVIRSFKIGSEITHQNHVNINYNSSFIPYLLNV